MTNKPCVPVSPAKRRAQWLRIIGYAILLLGIVGGGEVYRMGLLSPDLMDDPEMIGFDRAEKRQMGLLFGKQGAMIVEFDTALKRPKTQAFIFFVGAVLVAGGCWYFASLLDQDGTPQ